MINLLIVDDDIATVDVIRDSIEWKQLDVDNVYTAFNVSSAKRILTEQVVDIIISDIEMPQETGLDFIKWIREEEIECEFLFLTCHESFSYATNAIHYEAAAYLTKPFDLDIMKLQLQKIVTKLKQKRNLNKNSEYGVLMIKNHRFMKLDFWKSVLEGNLLDEARLVREIKNRNLDINSNKKYCFVYSKISNIEADVKRFERSIFEFILEGFHSEILTDKVENENVIRYDSEETLSFVSICEAENRSMLKSKCDQLIETSKKYLKSTITCYISNDYAITELLPAKKKIKKLSDNNIGSHGSTFLEDEVVVPSENEIQIINLEKMVVMVEAKDKAQILRYLKQVFDELSTYKKLNLHSLYLMKQEIVQVVYADLMNKGIQATKLFYDELSIKMADHAMESIVDMIRWVNYLLEKTFEYEEEVSKAATMIDKINHYIHEHYAEEIGRNEIAGMFYLTPEHLAKSYKKKTGINLKDYINEYRIEKAKELLKSGERNVSDIAEAVGFDNFSYFSTLFKKITGVSPKNYKNTK